MNQTEKLAQSYHQEAMKIIAQLPSADLHPINNRLADLYDTKERIGRGIYAIYEKGKLMYIGRTSKGKEWISALWSAVTSTSKRLQRCSPLLFSNRLTAITKPPNSSRRTRAQGRVCTDLVCGVARLLSVVSF